MWTMRSCWAFRATYPLTLRALLQQAWSWCNHSFFIWTSISASINTKLLQKDGGPLKALPIEFKVEDGERGAANPVRSLLNYWATYSFTNVVWSLSQTDVSPGPSSNVLFSLVSKYWPPTTSGLVFWYLLLFHWYLECPVTFNIPLTNSYHSCKTPFS